nr:hypothetical protein [uncultured Rhodopila sp.]
MAARVTGTGTAARPALGEVADRPGDVFLHADFLARCGAGLPVIVQHPEGTLLDAAAFENTSVGTTVFGYRATPDGIADPDGTEAWCIARIFSPDAIEAMRSGAWSTSPGVLASGKTETQPDGTKRLTEASPHLLDHLALVPPIKTKDGSIRGGGTWDRGGPPAGIRIDSVNSQTGTQKMPDETKLAGDAPPWQAVLDALTGITKRLDALEKPAAAAAEQAEADPTRPTGNEYSRANDREATENNERASLQARFDAIFNHHSDQAPPPMAGEKAADYRVRLLRLLQRHSADFRNVNLEALRADALGAVESRIIADTIAASKTPAVAPGLLREVRRRDPMTGQQIIEFFGDPSAWMDQFGQRPMFATRISNGSDRR